MISSTIHSLSHSRSLGRLSSTLLIAVAAVGTVSAMDYSPLRGNANFGLGDFDGDGKTDVGVYVPSSQTFYIIKSSTVGSDPSRGGALIQETVNPEFLDPTQPVIPVTGDYLGIGQAYFGLFQSTSRAGYPMLSFFRNVQSQWYEYDRSMPYYHFFDPGYSQASEQALIPIAGDFDGDGTTDLATYDPITSTFFITYSSSLYYYRYNGFQAIQFGQGINAGGLPIPCLGDFNGDGRTDLCVFQPATATFYVLLNATDLNAAPEQAYAYQFGQGIDAGGDPVPIIGDFDHDGRSDLAVFQHTTSTYYVLPSSGAPAYAQQFGAGTLNGGDPMPLIGDYAGDARSDLAFFQPAQATFFVDPTGGSPYPYFRQFGPPSNSMPLCGPPTLTPRRH